MPSGGGQINALYESPFSGTILELSFAGCRMENEERTIDLTDTEMRVVARAAEARMLKYDASKRTYTLAELAVFGVVRETYTPDELTSLGFHQKGVISSFDGIAKRAEKELLVGTPFANGIKKWQLPVDVPGVALMMTRFPPDTIVNPHVHPLSEEGRGGGFRLITKGSIIYNGTTYGPGDWFYIPNGTPYSFVTDPRVETEEAYYYEYTGVQRENRFSAPIKA